MTDQPEVNQDQATPEPTSAGQPVIRDRRRVRATPAGGGAAASSPAGGGEAPAGSKASGGASPSPAGETPGSGAGPEAASATVGEPAGSGAEPPGATGTTGGDTTTPEVVDGEIVTDGAQTAAEEEDATAAEPEPEVTDLQAPGGFAAELEAVRAELDERTRDLQRLSAEYANYRKRVERDRALIGEQATANVLSALLPVLDDLDRAREHEELAEGVSAVVDQLVATTRKFGLTAFGEKGDPFDPNRHEAVAHQTSGDVSEPTCVDILRRGYLLGDRLLRPAMVAVADPE